MKKRNIRRKDQKMRERERERKSEVRSAEKSNLTIRTHGLRCTHKAKVRKERKKKAYE